MLSYVAERLQLQASGLTRYEAIEALNRHEIKEGASELDELLSECETGCYAGMATREVAALVASGRACLAVIGRQRLSGNDSRWSGYIRKSCSAKAGTTALVLAMCLSWGYSQAEASVTGTFDLTRSQSERMLEEAAHAYERGQAVDGDAATAKESFAEAAHKYQALVDSGIDNGRLYFNLAGAYLQSGDPVRALVNYERAASLMSGDTSVVAGRNHAIFLLTGEKTELEGSLTERALAWNNSLSVNARTIVGIACWSVLWITLAAALCVSLVAWRPIAITAAVVFALCALSLGLQWSDPTAGDRGIVITAATQLREGNGQGFAAVSDSALEPGTCFEIVQRRGGWLQVRTSDGRAGWLATENADLIPSRDWRAI
jgi:Flp pilus assembly protein TadD